MTIQSDIGHAPNYLRTAFDEFVETDEVPAGHTHRGQPLNEVSLLIALARCSDIMPSSLCASLDLPAGSTYADGVRAIDHEIDEQLTVGVAEGEWAD